MYSRGAELITDTSLRKEDVKEQAKPMRVALHLNMAACHLKLEELNEAIKECNEVIAVSFKELSFLIQFLVTLLDRLFAFQI